MHFYRYSFEGVLQAIYGFEREPLVCEEASHPRQCMFNDAESVLKELDVENAKFWVDFVVLCGFFVLLRLGCYLVLRWRVKVR